MMIKRTLAGLLSLLVLLSAPGLASYAAAADVVGKVPSGAAPVITDLKAPTQLAPLAPLAGVGTLPTAGVEAQLPASNAAPEASAPQTGVQALAENPQIKAAVDSEHPQAQAPALQKVYENVGPNAADRAVFTSADGPIYHVDYRPAGSSEKAEASLKPSDDRTPVHIVVGAGGGYHRGWYYDWVKGAVSEISGSGEIAGLKSVVIDSPEHRPEGVEHFIAANLTDLSDENKKAVGEAVAKYLEEHKLVAVGANALIQGYIRMATVVQAAVKERNNPDILVNPSAAVEATVDKLATRMIVGEQVESLKWPAVSPGTIDDPDIEEKAVATFREISAKVPSHKVVLKLVTAAGKAGLRAGGIGSEAEMREAVRGVIKELKEYWGADPEKRTLYIESEKNGPSRFLIEGMIDRLTEVDVELTMSSIDGKLDVAGFIIGNPNPGENEKGYLFNMNGLLSPELQRLLVLSATEAVVATWKKFGALPFGNFHVEMMLRGDAHDPKPALIEINATRPIGGSGVRFAKEWHPEVNLIRNGVRAALGLPQSFPKEQPQDSMLTLHVSPMVTGTVAKVDVPADMAQAKITEFGKDGITKKADAPIYVPVAEAGEKVEGFDGPHVGTLGAVVVRGKDGLDVARKAIAATARVNYETVKADGTTRVQNGAEEHSELDYRVLPSDKPHLTAKASGELDAYEEAQLRWTPIFKVYYPLFSAVMNAMGGLAAIGIGRVGYTVALFVATPFSSVLASHLPVKKVLRYTWIARIGIWAALLPAAVLLFPAGGWALPAAIFALNFLDGLMVSLSHTVDMDAGGMDMVAKQGGFSEQMTPEVRKHYVTRYLAWSSKVQYIFPLGIAVAVLAATYFSLPIKWAFMAGMAGVFLIQGGRAVKSLARMGDDAKLPAAQHGVWTEFKDGVKMVNADRKLKGLVLLEALERSISDSLFMVAFPMLGLFAIKPVLHLNDAGANLAATILMSIMSYAGMKASLAAKKGWKAPEKGAAEDPYYKPLYKQMFLAAATLVSLPAAFFLMTAGQPILGLLVAAAGAAAFMVSFKKAQVGEMNMFQTAAGEHEGATRIFGLASAVAMLVSGAAVWGLESLFSVLRAGPAFVALSAFFLAVGAAYWAIWPRLASKTAKSAEKKT